LITFPTIIWYVSDLSNTILFFLLFFIFFKNLVTKKNIITLISVSVLSSLLDYYLDGISLVLAFFTILFFLRNIKSITLTIKLILFTYNLLIVSLTQSISGYISFNILNIKVTPSFKEAILSTALIIIINYALSISIILITKYLFSKEKSNILHDKIINSIILFSTALATIGYAFLILLFKYLKLNSIYLKSILIISIIIIIFIIIGMFFFISSRLREIKISSELNRIKERKSYIKELERKNNELHRFKHDYKNFLLSLSVSLKSDNIDNDSIQKLLSYADTSIDSNINIENNNLYHMDDELVKGIIITKLILAKDKDIKTNFEIDDNPSIPKETSIELTRILGILLDNAIDACLLTDNPELDFALISFDDHIEFIIKNNISNESTIDLNKIYQTGYTTKAKHGGLGLSTVRKIIDSHSNLFLQTKIDDNFFTIILTILKGN